jgi:hypothetical protein
MARPVLSSSIRSRAVSTSTRVSNSTTESTVPATTGTRIIVAVHHQRATRTP